MQKYKTGKATLTVIISKRMILRHDPHITSVPEKTSHDDEYLRRIYRRNHVSLRPATLLKKRLWHICFLVSFVKFFINTFFTEHLWTTASSIFRTLHNIYWSFIAKNVNGWKPFTILSEKLHHRCLKDVCNLVFICILRSEVYSEPRQTSKMERFANIMNG